MKSTLLFTLASSAAIERRSTYMDCGDAPYCGVLVLERGGGSGNYYHRVPTVHGLWPERGNYGSSQCAGGDPNAYVPSVSCYSDSYFQQHEWTSHGVCGARSPTSFFKQVCNLASEPLSIMTQMKADGSSLYAMAQTLANNGYPVFNPNAGNDQLELSVCAGSDLYWKFSEVSSFSSNCGY